jgi:hypothetical protein
MENEILTVAFVIAITAFFKDKMGLKGWWVLLAAFLVLLFLTYIPVVIALYPPAAPWLTPLVRLITVVLAAVGSVDFVKMIRSPKPS